MMVSVIIPTFNRVTFIRDTVDSVLSQTVHDMEVIVIDDGSTDGTGELIRTHYAKEPRVRYIWQENAERSVARNHGIRVATGEFIAFIDSDDLWHPTKLERQMECFMANPQLVMVHTDWCQLYEDGIIVPIGMKDPSCAQGNMFGAMVYHNLIGTATPLVRRWVFDQIGGFNEDRRLLCFEDWEMWTRIAVLGPVGYITEVLATRRRHAGNTEKAVDPMVYRRFVETIVRSVKRPQRCVAITSARQRFWVEINRAVQRQDIAVARSYFWNGMACLGPRFLIEAISTRWTIGNLIFGSQIARTLLAFWQRRYLRHRA